MSDCPNCEALQKERDEHKLARELGWSTADCPMCGETMAGPWTDNIARANEAEADLAAARAENERLKSVIHEQQRIRDNQRAALNRSKT